MSDIHSYGLNGPACGAPFIKDEIFTDKRRGNMALPRYYKDVTCQACLLISLGKLREQVVRSQERIAEIERELEGVDNLTTAVAAVLTQLKRG